MRDKFIKVKRSSGDDVFVNSSHIVVVDNDKKGSRLYFIDGTDVLVSTTMTEMEMLLDVYSKEKRIEELKQENFKMRQQTSASTNRCKKIGEYF